MPLPAAVLGGGGLVPFAVGALGLWLAPVPWDTFAFNALMYYAAVILSFLGAVHWGLALAAGAADWSRLGWGVAPALVGWVALLIAAPVGLLMLIAAFVAHYWADGRAAAAGLAPPWYPRLRRPLTIGAVLALGSALIRVI